MLSATKDMFADLLSSKKFFIFIASLIAAGAARLGWNVDQAVIDHYLELAGALILAQGVADHGKGAVEAQIKAGITPASTPTKSPSTAPVIAVLMLVGLGAAVTHTSTGCSSLTTGAKATGGALIDCAKQDLGQLVGDQTLLAVVTTDLAQGDYAAALDALIGKVGQDALACAVKAVETVATSGRPATSEPSPLALHAQAEIATHKWQYAAGPK